MKKYFKIITLLLITLLISNCNNEDLSDLNINPNNPEKVPTSAIFNSATKEYIDNVRGGFISGRFALPWMQYWGQNAYADEDRYAIRETTRESFYTTSYRVATDFKAIIEANTNPDTREANSSFGNNENQIAASRVMLCYVFHQLVDAFGDVPYYSFGSSDPDFEALDVENILSPKFASQEKIYMDILNELTEASNQIVLSEPVFTSGDVLYNGNAGNWKKFANSLKLRVANRLRGVNPSVATTNIDEAILAGVFTSNADNASQKYETQLETASPIFRSFATRFDFAVTQPFVELLKGDRGSFGLDKRLFEMAAPKTVSIASVKANNYTNTTNPADYVGIAYAFPLANKLAFTNYSWGSSKVIKSDFSEIFMEFAEVSFILSEHNNWNQTHYKNGVEASMKKWGVAAADITAFITSLPAASQETVLNQKYIASYMQPLNAWAEYRRTGFPNTLITVDETITLDPDQAVASSSTTYVFVPLTMDTDIPFRIAYPTTLQTLNGANRSAAVSLLSNGDTQQSKLFWDVN